MKKEIELLKKEIEKLKREKDEMKSKVIKCNIESMEKSGRILKRRKNIKNRKIRNTKTETKRMNQIIFDKNIMGSNQIWEDDNKFKLYFSFVGSFPYFFFFRNVFQHQTNRNNMLKKYLHGDEKNVDNTKNKNFIYLLIYFLFFFIFIFFIFSFVRLNRPTSPFFFQIISLIK